MISQGQRDCFGITTPVAISVVKLTKVATTASKQRGQSDYMQRVKMRLTKSQYCFLFHICLVDWVARFFFSSFFCLYYLRRKKCMKQFSIKCWFALLCSVIGPEILSLSLSQPIRCKTSTNHDLVARVFPRLRRLACFYFELSLALHDNLFSSD